MVFLSFAKNISTNATKVAKNIINMVKNLLTQLQKSATDATKTASKRAIQKTAAATRDLLGNKIADKIMSTPRKSLLKPRDEDSSSNEVSKEIPKERHISPKERQQIIDELRLI